MRALLLFIPLTLAVGIAKMSQSDGKQLWTEAEKKAVLNFWEKSASYEIGMPESARRNGKWVVRLTADGSDWLHRYMKFKGIGKIPPSQEAASATPDQKIWNAWVDAKIAYDNWIAAQDARAKNMQEMGLDLPAIGVVPPDPGLIPEALLAGMGEPPAFASAVMPRAYTVNFGDGKVYRYTDNPMMRQKYAYYRFPQGVQDGGTAVKNMSESEIQSLFGFAGLNDSVFRVMRAVSALEGGFDSINTYDTGYLSVGLIQFATLKDGAGSLGQVLLRQKQENSKAFQSDFRKYGIDVTPKGQIVALDLWKGEERIGRDANFQIINDKRLTAVFQRAGQLSPVFRACQLKIAKEMYYPENEMVTVKTATGTYNLKCTDLFKSEAGMATLMDRKVNTGTLGPIQEVANQVATELVIEDPMDLAMFEDILIRKLKFRRDFLIDTSLIQPRTQMGLTDRMGKIRRTITQPPKPKTDGTSGGTTGIGGQKGNKSR